MAAVRKKQSDDKILQNLRELASLPGNKHCFDCLTKGVTYVNMTIGSFTCTSCSGILRGLTPPHRVKSISMAKFTDEEVKFLQQHGNDECTKSWLGLWDAKRVIKMDHKDFMVEKYERKRYFLEPASPLKSIPSTTQQQSANRLLSESSTLKSAITIPPSLTKTEVTSQQKNMSLFSEDHSTLFKQCKPPVTQPKRNQQSVNGKSSIARGNDTSQDPVKLEHFADFEHNQIYNAAEMINTCNTIPPISLNCNQNYLNLKMFTKPQPSFAEFFQNTPPNGNDYLCKNNDVIKNPWSKSGWQQNYQPEVNLLDLNSQASKNTKASFGLIDNFVDELFRQQPEVQKTVSPLTRKNAIRRSEKLIDDDVVSWSQVKWCSPISPTVNGNEAASKVFCTNNNVFDYRSCEPADKFQNHAMNNNRSGLNGTKMVPSADKYAALKDLDEQFREIQTTDKIEVPQTTTNTTNPFKSNPFQFSLSNSSPWDFETNNTQIVSANKWAHDFSTRSSNGGKALDSSTGLNGFITNITTAYPVVPQQSTGGLSDGFNQSNGNYNPFVAGKVGSNNPFL